jgi:hypothetical protein
MGRAGKLEVVTPAEFRSRTSLTLSSRSGTTLAMDKAYDDYYATRSATATRVLYRRLTEYRTEHGNAWNLCDRNAVSGGLLEYLHNLTYSGALSPEKALELDKKAAARIRDIEIPHARFGVLYLLANIRLEMDAVGMAIEGVGAIGGAVGVGMTTNFNQLGSAAKAVRAVQSVGGHGITASQIATGGTQVMKLGKGIVEGVMAPSASAPGTIPSTATSDFARYLPFSAAALEGVSAGLSDVWNKNKYMGAAAYAGAGLVALPGAAVVLMADAGRVIWEKLKSAFKSLGDMLMSAWRKRYDVATAQKLGMALKKATVIAIDLIMKHSVPVLSGAIDLGSGLARTIGEACTRIASWSDRRHIRIQSGHPQEIANSIEHEMSLGICGGLVDVLRGAARVAIGVFLPGLGSLVSVVMSAIEWLIKFLSRLGEQLAIDQFLVRARQLYDAEQRRSRKVNGVYETNTQPGSIITDTKEFTAFFLQGCKASPLIPMLSLNSGLGGSLMTLIKLFDADGAQSSALSGGRKEFDIGDAYFTRLKRYSVDYMRKSGFKFFQLRADDKSMAGYLVHAQGLAREAPVNPTPRKEGDVDHGKGIGKQLQSHVAAGGWGGRLVAIARS